jgi:hypothetical protein
MNELAKRETKRPRGYVREDGWIWLSDHWVSPETLTERKAKQAQRDKNRRLDPEFREKNRKSKVDHYYRHRERLLAEKRNLSEDQKKLAAEREKARRNGERRQDILAKRRQRSKTEKYRVKQNEWKRSRYKSDPDVLAKKRESRKRLLESNPELRTKTREAARKRYAKNPDKYRRYFREWNKKQRSTSPEFKCIVAMRNGFRQFLKQKGCTKTSKTMAVVGCTPQQLRDHLESQFKRGMTWENHGKVWHIDHIVPVSHFGITEDEIARAWNWQNLRPLLARQNMSEGNRRSCNQPVLPLTLSTAPSVLP